MLKFIDNSKNENLENGVEYFAVGLVADDNAKGVPTHSGKDVLVTYINPWGEVCNCWRAYSEVTLSEISDADADLLLQAFERLK